jgi:peptide/nickel transport system substrate-binding protein
MRSRIPLVVVAAALAITACSSDDDGSSAATAPSDTAAADTGDTGDTDTGDTGDTDETGTETEDAASGDSAGDDAAATAGDMVIAISGDETSLNPYTYVTGYPGWNLLNLIHDSLLVLDENNEPQPLLATEWSISDDGLTYDLTLRDDVTWHDGEPFDADDVAFTFGYVVENTQSRWTPGVAAVESVTVNSPTEVTIQLNAASPDFPVRPLADMPIMAEHVWTDVTDPNNASGVEQNIGTGPYRLAEYNPDQSYLLEANVDYAMGTPLADTISLAVIPEPSTAFAALRAGEVDMVSSIVEAQLVQEFQNDGDLDVQIGPGFGSTMLNINNERAPLDDPEVRRALGLAVNPQELIDTVLLGTGTPPNSGFLHPNSPIATESVEHVFDVAEANSILDGLGAELGDDGTRVLDGEPMSFELLVYADNPGRIRTAEILAEQFAEIGVSITVAPLDAETVDEQVWPGFDVSNGRDYDLAMWGWSPPVQLDAGRYGSLFHSDTSIGTFNVVGFSDPDVDGLVDQLRAATSAEERDPVIDELQARVAELRPFITLYYPDGAYAFRPDSFDGWVYQAGQGPLGKISLVDFG